MLGRNAVELSVMVWGSEKDLLRMIQVEGLEHLRALEGRPVIALAPHFIGLNMGGIRVAHEYPGTASVYSRQKNPVLERIFLTARTRFGRPAPGEPPGGPALHHPRDQERQAFYFLPTWTSARATRSSARSSACPRRPSRRCRAWRGSPAPR
jgi:KDO2-lipid IV(A) lauroyltransferase